MTNPKIVTSRNSFGEGVTAIMRHPGAKFEKKYIHRPKPVECRYF